MIAALGVGSRPCFTRVFSRSAVWMRFQVPSLRHVRKYVQTVVEARKIVRQGSPLASRAVQVHKSIEHFAHLGGTWMTARLGGRDQGFQNCPLLVSQIAWVAFSSPARPPRRLRVLSFLHLSTPFLFYHFSHSL
jgi:hypothetical protein